MVWEDGKYRASEVARLQPDMSKRAPGRKDRRRWCRGKVGVEHVTEPQIVSYVRSLPHECSWRLDREGRPARYTEPESLSWSGATLDA